MDGRAKRKTWTRYENSLIELVEKNLTVFAKGSLRSFTCFQADRDILSHSQGQVSILFGERSCPLSMAGKCYQDYAPSWA